MIIAAHGVLVGEGFQIGHIAAALSLMLATPAMAVQHGYHHHYGHVSHRVSRAYAFDRGYDFTPGNVRPQKHLQPTLKRATRVPPSKS
jgi:hypothetical protein